MLKQINIWKEEQIQLELENIEKAKEQVKQLKNEYGYCGMCSLVEYQQIPKFYKDLFSVSKEYRLNRVTKEVEKHIARLQDKVQKVIGKITDINYIGGMDYLFQGENGSCAVEVIVAGGYNIQRVHTRWIIKK